MFVPNDVQRLEMYDLFLIHSPNYKRFCMMKLTKLGFDFSKTFVFKMVVNHCQKLVLLFIENRKNYLL